jgi:hypothetical protein
VVRAPALTRESLLAAMNQGDFYASTGVALKDVRAAAGALTVDIEASPAGGSPSRFRVVFIGRDGRVLATANDNPARYVFAGTEGYVRARVEESNGLRAWTQPVFLKRASEN